MLPSLKKIGDRQFSATEGKVYHPPKQFPHHNDRKQGYQSVRNPKTKAGGGFKLSFQTEQFIQNDSHKIVENSNAINSKTLQYVNIIQKKSSVDVSRELKLIEKKIRQCQKKIEQDKKRRLQQQRKAQYGDDEHDFQQIIKRQMQLQGYKNDQKRFDYLTNPGGKPQPQQQQELQAQQPVQQMPIDFSINDQVQRLQRFYQNSLKKKFERRQAFPHKPCKRKTPKLYITQKTNALNKKGKPLTDEEHRFRVMTKETTPQQIYPVIPNFAVVKDNLSKNIVSYLGDYKPFLDKTKEKVEKQMKKDKEAQAIEVNNMSKPVTVEN